MTQSLTVAGHWSHNTRLVTDSGGSVSDRGISIERVLVDDDESVRQGEGGESEAPFERLLVDTDDSGR